MTNAEALAKLNDVEDVCRLVIGTKDALVTALETVNATTKAEMALTKLRQKVAAEESARVEALAKADREDAAYRASMEASRKADQERALTEQLKYDALAKTAKGAYSVVMQQMKELEATMAARRKVLTDKIEEESARLVKIQNQILTDKQKVNAL